MPPRMVNLRAEETESALINVLIISAVDSLERVCGFTSLFCKCFRGRSLNNKVHRPRTRPMAPNK